MQTPPPVPSFGTCAAGLIDLTRGHDGIDTAPDERAKRLTAQVIEASRGVESCESCVALCLLPPLAGRSPSAWLGGGLSCYLIPATDLPHVSLATPPCQVCRSCMYLARLQCWPEGAGWRIAARTFLLTLGGCAAMHIQLSDMGRRGLCSPEGQLLFCLVSLGHH